MRFLLAESGLARMSSTAETMSCGEGVCRTCHRRTAHCELARGHMDTLHWLGSCANFNKLSSLLQLKMMIGPRVCQHEGAPRGRRRLARISVRWVWRPGRPGADRRAPAILTSSTSGRNPGVKMVASRTWHFFAALTRAKKLTHVCPTCLPTVCMPAAMRSALQLHGNHAHGAASAVALGKHARSRVLRRHQPGG